MSNNKSRRERKLIYDLFIHFEYFCIVYYVLCKFIYAIYKNPVIRIHTLDILYIFVQKLHAFCASSNFQISATTRNNPPYLLVAIAMPAAELSARAIIAKANRNEPIISISECNRELITARLLRDILGESARSDPTLLTTRCNNFKCTRRSSIVAEQSGRKASIEYRSRCATPCHNRTRKHFFFCRGL